MKYVALGRQNIKDLSEYKNKSNIAYMSIPSQHFFQCIEPYKHFFTENKPLFVIEKPHGISPSNFRELQSYFDDNKCPVIYNDHYIAKDSVLNINNMILPEFKEISQIDITLHESMCVNDRIEYFDTAGILLDMYQSHVLIVLSILLAKLENIDRVDVLKHIAKCVPFQKSFGQYDAYAGSAFTKCKLSFIYKGVIINVSCGKKLTDEKSLCLQTRKGSYTCIDLSNSKGNPYDTIFKWLDSNNTSQFLSNEEISLLWKHVSLF